MQKINFGPTIEEIKKSEAWAKKKFIDNNPPFSFKYDGIPFEKLKESWKSEIKSVISDDTEKINLIYTALDGLKVTCNAVRYLNHAATEWTVFFENTSSDPSKMLTDVKGVDVLLYEKPENTPLPLVKLYSFKGDACVRDGYEPMENIFLDERPVSFYSLDGRPTNEFLPYYRLQNRDHGFIYVLSWQGQWESMFQKTPEGFRVLGGQKTFASYLLPGETVRTPMGFVLQYDGNDQIRAINLWRRWYIECGMPKVKGEKIKPFYSCYPGRIYNEMELATEENLKSYADLYLDNDIPFDYLWIDAGWYDMGGEIKQGPNIWNWPRVGTWKVDRNRFPNGLRPVTDHVRNKAGVKTILWFEPERVTRGTELYTDHDEWCLRSEESEKAAITNPEQPWNGSRLLNLGDENARKWITERVISLIESEGIDLYRQDFNFAPLKYWLENDVSGREGILENHYCTGYLKFWDDIMAAYPDIIIDSCASGGRRNDLETLKRSLPLHKTDYTYTDMTAKHGFHHSLFQWFPFFGSMNQPGDQSDIYYQRSALLLSYHSCEKVFDEGYDFELNRLWMMEWRETAHCMYGDYIPLTPYSVDDREWIGWQFDNPDTNDGMIQMFVRPDAPYKEAAFKLYNLDETADYEIKDYNTGKVTVTTGKSLTENGILMQSIKQPDSFLFYYKKV